MSQDSWETQQCGPDELSPDEIWWSERQRPIEQAGYALRRRYRQNWVPSWRLTGRRPKEAEDAQPSRWRPTVMDAVRLSDGTPVVLKRLPDDEPFELDMYSFLCSGAVASNPHNHCAPLIDVVQLPGDDSQRLLVLPLLRPFYDPPFRTFGEVVAFLSQLFEVRSAFHAIQHLHHLRIAHRNCTFNTIMLDPTSMYPDSFHPCDHRLRRDWKGKAKCYSRTRRPPRYYLIDFHLARHYEPLNGPALDDPTKGDDATAPEHRDQSKLCDPFPTDIYYLGNLIRQQFVFEYYGFDRFMPLVNDMIQKDPFARPSIDDVVWRFEEICEDMGAKKMRARIVGRRESVVPRILRAVGHMIRTAGYIVARKPAIPMPVVPV
ncbi:hypothetical protein FA95DRAFT_1582303 [Auriscalpium vulgare]|uniref:Uncharacterized protein n=1 Tax=Auriscalpium vulgare TaxID=40419 RepID=A0ACB8RWG5_9AGAM|nr:hypothetical protein FA95DRAFT_1582303 [Auriscalpium vulgare]